MSLSFTLFMVFSVWWVPVAQGSVGPPILFYDNQTGPANFSWSLFNVSYTGVAVVDNPRQEEVFFLHSFHGNQSHDVTLNNNYSTRITTLNDAEGVIQFLLNGVTEDDAGIYTCRDGSHDGPIIPNCGQILYFLDARSVAMMPDAEISEQVEEGQNLSLICVVKVSALPIPNITWTFQPSDSRLKPPPKPETGVKLSLGPLTRNDSGLYTCRAGNDEDFHGGQSNINLTVIDEPETSSTPTPLLWLLVLLLVPLIGAVIIFCYCRLRGGHQPVSTKDDDGL